MHRRLIFARATMRIALGALCTLCALGSTIASTPSGRTHGAWHVASILSPAGDGTSDPIARMSQIRGEDELQVLWMHGTPIVISIKIRGCYAADGDFEQSYAIPTERWLGLSRRVLAERLKEDFSLWIKQSSLGCHNALKSQPFKLAKLDAAVDDFTNRVRVLSSFGKQ